MTDKQPEALRLAEACEHGYPLSEDAETAAAELRRLHALNAELVQALEAAQAEAASWQQQASDRVDDAVEFGRQRDEARAALEEAQRDAARYRWLRDDPSANPSSLLYWTDLPERDEVDARIDAAMQQGKT